MEVFVLSYRSPDHASVYVGSTEELAYKRFCTQFLEHHFASLMEEAVMDENYDGYEEPDELVQSWKLLRAGKWMAATELFAQYMKPDNEHIRVTAEEVES